MVGAIPFLHKVPVRFMSSNDRWREFTYELEILWRFHPVISNEKGNRNQSEEQLNWPISSQDPS